MLFLLEFVYGVGIFCGVRRVVIGRLVCRVGMAVVGWLIFGVR